MNRKLMGYLVFTPLAVTWLFFQYILGPVLFMEYLNKVLGGKGMIFLNL